MARIKMPSRQTIKHEIVTKKHLEETRQNLCAHERRDTNIVCIARFVLRTQERRECQGL
jgi:hypothetical protein